MRRVEVQSEFVVIGQGWVIPDTVSVRSNGADIAHVFDAKHSRITVQRADQTVPLWVQALRVRDRAERGPWPQRIKPVRIAIMPGVIAAPCRGARATRPTPL